MTTPRIGGISYLNVRPLVYGIEDQVGYCEPSRLADLMYQKRFDVVAGIDFEDRHRNLLPA